MPALDDAMVGGSRTRSNDVVVDVSAPSSSCTAVSGTDDPWGSVLIAQLNDVSSFAGTRQTGLPLSPVCNCIEDPAALVPRTVSGTESIRTPASGDVMVTGSGVNETGGGGGLGVGAADAAVGAATANAESNSTEKIAARRPRKE
jgi:hypothetical protein